MITANRNPKQLVRDQIDKMLIASGWVVKSKTQINLAANTGVAVREYQTDVGPADYILFVNKQPVGVMEAKREEEGVHLTVHEGQSADYAAGHLNIKTRVNQGITVIPTLVHDLGLHLVAPNDLTKTWNQTINLKIYNTI